MEEKVTLKRALRPIWPYLRPYRKAMILAPAFKFVEAVLELVTPLVVADIIDTGLMGGAGNSYVVTRCILMLVLAAVGYASALVCQITASKVSQGFGTSLRTGLWDKVLALPAAKRDAFGGATLVTRMTQDINQLQTAVAMLLRLVVRAPFLVIGATVMSFLVDAKLAVLFVVAGLLVGLLLYFVMGRTIPLYAKLQKKLDQLGLQTAEQLEGVRVIRAFGRQKSVQDQFLEQADEFSALAVRVGRLSALLQPGIYLVLNLAVVGLLWLGGLRVNTGSLQAGQILAMVSYMTQISLAMVVVANLVVLFTKAFASLDRVDELLTISTTSTTATSADSADKTAVQPAGEQAAPALVVRRLTFSYQGADNDSECVLDDISFQASQGETIGIIGGTGSGKSTLVKLILGFYAPTRGEIDWKGRPIASYPDQELRQQMGYVPQKATLFSGTIRSNLTWGHETADDETLWRALKTAQGAEVVQKKPGGLDFVLEPEGRNLSGGQRQRLTIARALAGNPALLILDDSASALDFATDAALRKALAEDAKNRLTLVISQRYPALRHADQILVLSDGRAVGFDTHDNLLLHCPVYRDICASQGAELPPYEPQTTPAPASDGAKGGAVQ